MKSLPIVLVIIVICYSAAAQSNQRSEKVDFKENLDNSTFLFSFNNKQNDKACLLMVGKQLIKGFIFSDSGKILNQFDVERTNKKIIPLGGYFEDDKISVLFGRDASDDNISKFSYAFSSAEIDTSRVMTDLENQSVLSVINTGDNVLFLCGDKKQPFMYIHKMVNGNLEKTEQYDFSTLTGFPYKEKEFYQRLKKSNIAFIDEYKQKLPALLASKNKVYYNNDSLIFILNSKSQSEIISLDRKLKICNYKVLEQPSDYCRDIFRVNSYLLHNDLYFVSICPWGLQLNITNILNGTRVAIFKTKANEDLSFKNTPFIKISGTVNKSDANKKVRTIENQKSFIMQVSSHSLIVTAGYDSRKNIVLNIGAFEINSPKENVARSMGLLDDLLWLAIQTPDWSTLTYFQSKLEASTYRHLEGKVEPTTEEKIAALMADKKIKPEYRLLLKYNSVNYFVYYDKEADSIILNKIYE